MRDTTDKTYAHDPGACPASVTVDGVVSRRTGSIREGDACGDQRGKQRQHAWVNVIDKILSGGC